MAKEGAAAAVGEARGVERGLGGDEDDDDEEGEGEGGAVVEGERHRY